MKKAGASGSDASADSNRSMLEARLGRVIFRSSRELEVLADERIYRCELRGRFRRERKPVVVGDRVRILPEGDSARGVVEEVLPRRNALSRRREVGGGSELVVAANLDQVLAVFAAKRPRLKFGALDRLLVACERNDLPPIIAINKVDLGISSELEARLENYERVGYPVRRISVEEDRGLRELEAELSGRATVVSGPSGVGKSSLLSAILGVPIRVGEVSEHNEKGRHTTTAARGYPAPGGGSLIDTPGFRDYGLWGLEPRDLGPLFPDFRPRLGSCRFSNCLHREEPDCAVLQAGEAGEIAPERIASYHHILATLEERR